METIRVNMTPCEDIKTIHASQNDNEAREWGFELHNNGEKIDSSSISDQLVFKAYEGGTEEILPENGSTPTTSPFKGDIKYPQGLLSDQEFLYRESPTEEDGLAKITDIKGNTLVWNQQLLAPTTSASTTASADGSFRSNRCTFTYDSATRIITITSLENMGTSGFVFGLANGAPLVVGHKYLQMCDVQAPKTFNFVIGINGNTDVKTGLSANTYHHVSTIKEFVSGTNEFLFNFHSNNAWVGTETVYIKNAMLFDLTQMDLDISSPSDFTSLFPLPFYAYNQGTLLSFSGNGIKTTGKNLFPYPYSETTKTQNGLTFTDNGDGTITVNGTATAQTYFNLFTNTSEARPKMIGGTYVFSNTNSLPMGAQATLTARKSDGTAISSFSLTNNRKEHSLTIGENFEYNSNISVSSGTTLSNYVFAFMFEFGSTATTSYEPYTSTTIDLPISTYFPTGMKSAGDVYDELTENKAITRVGSRAYQSGDESDTSVITDGTTTYYVLATPTETPITTASLVTENGEIPLSNEDGVLIGKCTEQLSSESGFIDAKIKLADDDGECYSNKIQLHIERSPQ